MKHKLPNHVIQHIYSFDPTYHHVFNQVLNELSLHIFKNYWIHEKKNPTQSEPVLLNIRLSTNLNFKVALFSRVILAFPVLFRPSTIVRGTLRTRPVWKWFYFPMSINELLMYSVQLRICIEPHECIQTYKSEMFNLWSKIDTSKVLFDPIARYCYPALGLHQFESIFNDDLFINQNFLQMIR